MAAQLVSCSTDSCLASDVISRAGTSSHWRDDFSSVDRAELLLGELSTAVAGLLTV